MRVLLLTQETTFREAISSRLRRSGFAVDHMVTLEDARVASSVNGYTCLVIDELVNDGDAFDLIAEHRNEGHDTPIIVIGEGDDPDLRMKSFELGIDDFLSHPCDIDELTARVNALSRRTALVAEDPLQIGGLVVDAARREVQRDGQVIPLRRQEHAVLEHLVANAGSVVSRTDLIKACWDEFATPMSNVVDVQIRGLRAKLGEPPLIETVRGAGYRFVTEHDRPEEGVPAEGTG